MTAQEKLAALERTLATIAYGRRQNRNGHMQRITRDELKTIAHECCERIGINWNGECDGQHESRADQTR